VRDNDAIEARDFGRAVILPQSFYGGARNKALKYHNSMALVRRFGKPTLFITFTTNPQWPEIRRHLARTRRATDDGDDTGPLRHGAAHYDPATVCRVFKLKLDQLLHNIADHEVFCRTVCYSATVEFQKRGLPHTRTAL
jgi:hypothetical protein